jgi:hypothetical protein
MHQVRGRQETNAILRGHELRSDHRAHRALAVRAGNMDGGKIALRMIQMIQKPRDDGEPQLDVLRTKRKQAIEEIRDDGHVNP